MELRPIFQINACFTSECLFYESACISPSMTVAEYFVPLMSVPWFHDALGLLQNLGTAAETRSMRASACISKLFGGQEHGRLMDNCRSTRCQEKDKIAELWLRMMQTYAETQFVSFTVCMLILLQRGVSLHQASCASPQPLLR